MFKKIVFAFLIFFSNINAAAIPDGIQELRTDFHEAVTSHIGQMTVCERACLQNPQYHHQIELIRERISSFLASYPKQFAALQNISTVSHASLVMMNLIRFSYSYQVTMFCMMYETINASNFLQKCKILSKVTPEYFFIHSLNMHLFKKLYEVLFDWLLEKHPETFLSLSYNEKILLNISLYLRKCPVIQNPERAALFMFLQQRHLACKQITQQKYEEILSNLNFSYFVINALPIAKYTLKIGNLGAKDTVTTFVYLKDKNPPPDSMVYFKYLRHEDILPCTPHIMPIIILEPIAIDPVIKLFKGVTLKPLPFPEFLKLPKCILQSPLIKLGIIPRPYTKSGPRLPAKAGPRLPAKAGPRLPAKAGPDLSTTAGSCPSINEAKALKPSPRRQSLFIPKVDAPPLDTQPVAEQRLKAIDVHSLKTLPSSERHKPTKLGARKGFLRKILQKGPGKRRRKLRTRAFSTYSIPKTKEPHTEDSSEITVNMSSKLSHGEALMLLRKHFRYDNLKFIKGKGSHELALWTIQGVKFRFPYSGKHPQHEIGHAQKRFIKSFYKSLRLKFPEHKIQIYVGTRLFMPIL